MKVLQNPIFFENGCAAALGTFDGVHLGHQRVVSVAVESGFTPVVIMIMQKNRKKRIFSDELNFSFLEKLGVDTVICLELDEIRDMTPDEYLEMLYKKMNVRLFVCGENHRFGKGACGNYDDINRFCIENRIESKKCETVTVNGITVSSTVIRECITNGEMQLARLLMGHWYTIDFTVQKGDGRGHKMGFPTINQQYDEGYVLPRFGVYAGTAVVDGQEYSSVLNIGIRPTFLTEKPLAETHIIGYSGDLYGEKVRVRLKKHIRDENKFSSIDEIISAIQNDKNECIKILKDCD